jgi:hypothetical protein
MPLLVLGLFSLSADMMIDPAGVSAKVSGDATLTWGIDLDSNATGFTNEMTSNLEVTVIAKQSTDSGMMDDSDDLYAFIKLKDFSWVADKDGGATTAPGVEAKLIMGAFSITTYSQPTVEVDFVDPTDDDDNDAADTETDYAGSGGLTLGYKLDPVTLSLGVISENDWKDDDPDPADKDVAECHIHGDDPETDDVEDASHVRACANANDLDRNDANAYAFLGTIGLAIGDNANLDAAIAYGHEYDSKPIGIGAKATFDLGDIDPHIAFDGKIPEDDSGIPWDVGAGIKWNLSDDEKSSFATELTMYAPADGESELGVSATLTEGDADDGALEGLGAKLMVALNDLTSDSSTWSTEVSAHYKVEGIKPYFTVKFSNVEDAKTAFTAGLELSMISNLTTTLQYASEDITGGSDRGDVTAAVKIHY